MAVSVRQIRAANPSPMTGTGTNSYVLGQGRVAVIDPGPAEESHLTALLAALNPGETVEAILVTHAHLDHSALAPRLAAVTGAPVLAFGPATAGRSPQMQALAAAGLTGGGEGVDSAFTPDRLLSHGERLALGPHEIEVLHTPGHMGCHLAFACEGLLFSGDHAMGWATSLVSPPDGDMGAYMASLALLAGRSWRQMLPGHGEAVEDPARRLAELTRHRRQREAAVLAALVHGPASAASLAARLYHDTPTALLPAAARNVLAHLIDLSTRNLATSEAPLTAQSLFHLP